MADDSQRLVIDLEARLTNFEKSMKRAGVVADTNWKGVEARGQAAARRVDSSFARISRPRAIKMDAHAVDVSGIQKALDSLHLPHGLNLEHLKGSIGGLAAGLGLAEVAKLGDEWTSAGNKIASAHVEAEKVPVVLAQVADMAERSRVSLESAASVYSGMSRAAHTFGASQAEVAIAAETVSKALATSGATTQEQQGAIRDLVQGMQAGVLRGQELRALLGEVPAIAEAIAREFGVSVGKVKELGTAGELTADRVFKAIVSAAPAVDATFAKTSATVEQSFENLKTAAARFVGQTAGLHAGTTLTTVAMQGLANNIAVVANGAMALGVVVATRLISGGLTPLASTMAANARAAAATAAAHIEFGSIVGTSAIRMGAATLAARGFSAALALVGGPVGAVLLGITAATVYFAGRAQEAEERSKRYADALAKVRTEAESTTPAIKGVGDAVAETAAKMNAVEINRLSQQLNQAQLDAAKAAEELRQFAVFVEHVDSATPNDSRLAAFFALVEKALTGDTKAALDAERAIDDLANMDPSFQGIANGFNPLLEKLAGVRASIAATKAEIASLSGMSSKPKADTSWAGGLDVRGEKDAFGAAIVKDRLDAAKNTDTYRARQKQTEILKDGAGTVSAGAAYRTGLAEIAIEDAPSGKGRGHGGKSQGSKNADQGAAQDADDEKKIADQIAALERQLREHQAVAAATRGLTEGTVAFNTAKETAVELSKNATEASSAEGQQIGALVVKIEQAKAAEEQLAKQREAMSAMKDTLTSGLADALDELILKGKNAGQVFASLAQTLESEAFKALLTGSGPMGGLFGGLTGNASGGILGGMFGGIGKVLGFADGGQISGPGTGRSDSVLARVSNGEFIVNAKATRANLGLLHAMNGGKLPAFASGGLVSPVALSAPALASGGGRSGDVHISSPVTVNAAGGTPEQNADLARQTSAHVEKVMRQLVVDELKTQMRSGNILSR